MQLLNEMILAVLIAYAQLFSHVFAYLRSNQMRFAPNFQWQFSLCSERKGFQQKIEKYSFLVSLVLMLPFISLSHIPFWSFTRNPFKFKFYSCYNVSHSCRQGGRSSHCTRNGIGCEKWGRAAFLATQKTPECFEWVDN